MIEDKSRKRKRAAPEVEEEYNEDSVDGSYQDEEEPSGYDSFTLIV